jgi:hypothetical protein
MSNGFIGPRQRTHIFIAQENSMAKRGVSGHVNICQLQSRWVGRTKGRAMQLNTAENQQQQGFSLNRLVSYETPGFKPVRTIMVRTVTGSPIKVVSNCVFNCGLNHHGSNHGLNHHSSNRGLNHHGSNSVQTTDVLTSLNRGWNQFKPWFEPV